MTLVTGTVQDLGHAPMDGTLYARPARFLPAGDVVYAPERTPYKIEGGTVSVELAPGPAVLELKVGTHARDEFRVVIPDQASITLSELLEEVFPWEPAQVSKFVAEREAAVAAKNDAVAAAGDAETAKGAAESAALQTGQDRTAVADDKAVVVSHVQALAEPNDAAVLGLISEGADTATKAALNATYADLPTVQAVDDRTKPQKMLFGLPVPQPHRAPNMAIMDVVPTSEFDGQVILAEPNGALWAMGRDSSLYKSTKRDVWTHVAYRSLGTNRRGGITRCKDGSLLLFSSTDFQMQRSTDEGKTWATVLARRAAGLEPLTTQSIAVHGETGHVFYGEYTNNVTAGWADLVLWRSTDHGATWQPFHTWPRTEVTPGPTAIRHIHGVQYDAIGKKIYVMCGDSTPATGIWRVEGETCVPVITNDDMPKGFFDAPRAIGMMFFPDYVAWGSDSTTNPYLFRITRADLENNPAALQRGPRLSSTAWGTARASEDGSRWAMFASDEAYPAYAGDRQAHIYAVEDQGATLYEVGAISSQMTSGVTTLQPCGPAESFSDHFWFNMRTGENGRNAAWKARLGYGGQTIPWPSTKSGHLVQSQSSGRITVEGNTSVQFGVTRVPSFGRTLAIYDSSLVRFSGEVGHVLVQVRSGGATLYSSGNVSNRQALRMEQGGPIFTVELPANQDVEFHISNGRATPAEGFASVTYGFLR